MRPPPFISGENHMFGGGGSGGVGAAVPSENQPMVSLKLHHRCNNLGIIHEAPPPLLFCRRATLSCARCWRCSRPLGTFRRDAAVCVVRSGKALVPNCTSTRACPSLPFGGIARSTRPTGPCLHPFLITSFFAPSERGLPRNNPPLSLSGTALCSALPALRFYRGTSQARDPKWAFCSSRKPTRRPEIASGSAPRRSRGVSHFSLGLVLGHPCREGRWPVRTAREGGHEFLSSPTCRISKNI